MGASPIRVAGGLLWLGGISADPRGVAYHRVCCRQDAAVAVRTKKKIATALQHLIEQFDSDFCVHTFGIGKTDPEEREGVWPHATYEGTQAFESHLTPLWSEHHFSRSHASGTLSRERSRSMKDMKCGTVEVFYTDASATACPLEVFTPMYIAGTSLADPKVRIGTGKGSWNGKSIVDYVEDEHHLKTDKLVFPSNRLLLRHGQCQSIVSKPMIESAVKSLGTSLDPKAVVRFLEVATNSRVPISNIFLRDEELKHPMTTKNLKDVIIADAMEHLCGKMGREHVDEDCLKAVPIEYLTPSWKKQFEFSSWAKLNFGTKRSSARNHKSSRARLSMSGTTVNLAPLIDGAIWDRLTRAIIPFRPKPIESRICDFRGEARMLDFVLMRAFLAVSGTSYAELHNRAMQKRLSTRKHWMLAACSENGSMTIRSQNESSEFLSSSFTFKLKGRKLVNSMRAATLSDVDTEGLESPICAVLAGVGGLQSPKPADGELRLWVAYFHRDKDGKDKVFRSDTGTADPWKFFDRRDGRLDSLLQEAKERIEATADSQSRTSREKAARLSSSEEEEEEEEETVV